MARNWTDPRLAFGTRHCRCSGCGEYFTTPKNFDLHRRKIGKKRVCVPPGTITTKKGKAKLHLNAKGLWSSAEGAYIPIRKTDRR